MKKNLLAENYKRLFKARPSSNDSKLLKEAIDSTPLGDPKVKNALKKLLNARKRNSEDETTHDQMEQYLVQLFTKMKLQDPESFASYMMEDEEFATGTVDGMISSIEFALEDEI